jgi:hypothetical protein
MGDSAQLQSDASTVGLEAATPSEITFGDTSYGPINSNQGVIVTSAIGMNKITGLSPFL